MRFRRILSIALFPLCFLVLAMVEKSVYPVLLLAQAAIHESGHIAAALLLRAKIRGLGTQYFGVSLVYDVTSLSYAKEIFILLSGAALNFICAALVFFLLPPSPELLFFTAAGAALGIFNLLPLRQTDGGRALRVLADSRRREDAPSRLPDVVFFLTTALFWAFAVFAQFLYRANLSLLTLAVYLFLEFLLCIPERGKPSISANFRG